MNPHKDRYERRLWGVATKMTIYGHPRVPSSRTWPHYVRGARRQDPRHFRQRPPEKIPIFGLCEPAPILSIEGVLSLRLRRGPAGPSF